MGCFDTIVDKIPCPKCGTIITDGIQTKDLNCVLNTYTLEEVADSFPDVHVITVFNGCPKCRAWDSKDATMKYDDWHFDIDIDEVREKMIREAKAKTAQINAKTEALFMKDVKDALAQKIADYNLPNVSYTCNDVESKKVNEFKEKHRHQKGSMVWVSFHGTGIGCIVQVKCDICDDEEDVTDIDSW